ncbi:DUF1127 domain-containing protein [Maliponia aquimaris]|uniref:YjiS-like domain-containing protein n=1 Tax=Maliponia aquimaris TaxID=1673631 RepID=A0A238L2X6_9RHOB|nr:DUF1127 domain-containing protein [Maliponia aquimaris]SMX48782.1 hypothetical protein MAA8898_04091 [Maliponia aquimaris]
MHPYLSHRDNLSQSLPYERAFRKRAKAGEVLRRWLSAATRDWQRRKMIAALSAMDDRLLRDIGIYRNDIARVVDGFIDRELRMTPVAENARRNETAYEPFRKAA